MQRKVVVAVVAVALVLSAYSFSCAAEAIKLKFANFFHQLTRTQSSSTSSHRK